MTLWCVECGCALPAAAPPLGRSLPDGVVLLRLVRGGKGIGFDWGALDQTPAPAVPICEQRAGKDCLGRLFSVRGLTLFPRLPERFGGRLFGWATDANVRYVTEYSVRQGLPRAYAVVCALEERGAVPLQYRDEFAWVIPWWRAMVLSFRGGK